MRFLMLVFVILVTLSTTGCWVGENPPELEKPRSPEKVGRHIGPGSGHAFGFGIDYEVVRHEYFQGEPWVVVHSAHEPEVEIWSPLPELVELEDGARFRLRQVAGMKLAHSLEVIE